MLCQNPASVHGEFGCDDIQTDVDCSCMSPLRQKHSQRTQREQSDMQKNLRRSKKKKELSIRVLAWKMFMTERSNPYLITTTLAMEIIFSTLLVNKRTYSV